MNSKQVENASGKWFKAGDSIKCLHNKIIKYGMIISVTASEVTFGRLVISTRKDDNSEISNLKGLVMMIYQPEVILTVKIKDILSAIFVGRKYLFDSMVFPFHLKMENVFAVELMKVSSDTKLVAIAEDLFTDGIATKTFPLIENSIGYKVLISMRIFMQLFLFICMRVHLSVYSFNNYMLVNTYIYIHVYICICIYMYVYRYLNIYIHKFIFMCRIIYGE
jgi:hypothetical protein